MLCCKSTMLIWDVAMKINVKYRYHKCDLTYLLVVNHAYVSTVSWRLSSSWRQNWKSSLTNFSTLYLFVVFLLYKCVFFIIMNDKGSILDKKLDKVITSVLNPLKKTINEIKSSEIAWLRDDNRKLESENNSLKTEILTFKNELKKNAEELAEWLWTIYPKTVLRS